MASTERTLALLDLLQRHRHWTGAELAERLGTTERTVRRDVERLRDLGYRIDSGPGARGGYRLEAGTSLPPLLLSADEAVAMAVGLRIAAAERLVDGAESALAALGKLDQLLPADLRRRVAAIAEALHPVTAAPIAPVDSDLLGTLALACRDRERVRFTYTASDGAETRRRVEPHALAPSHRRWYLVCWDLEREAWRTFRVDRIADLRLTRARFTPRPLAPARIEEMVAVATSWTPQPVEAAAVVAMSDGAQPCGREHDPERACRRCGEARKAAEKAEREAKEQRERDALDAARAARQSEADATPPDDGTGLERAKAAVRGALEGTP